MGDYTGQKIAKSFRSMNVKCEVTKMVSLSNSEKYPQGLDLYLLMVIQAKQLENQIHIDKSNEFEC